MTKLLSATLDSSVLAIPQDDCAKDVVYHYIENLLDWCELLGKSWVRLCMSEQAIENLTHAELYPPENSLKKLWAVHHITEWDVNTVSRVINKLLSLSLSESLESNYDVYEVLFEDLDLSPDILEEATHHELQSDLSRSLTLIAVLHKYCPRIAGSHALILKKASEQVIHVRALIHDLEHNRPDIPPFKGKPLLLEGDVRVCDDFRGLTAGIDESALFVNAADDLEVELAIRIALFKHAVSQGNFQDWNALQVPKIGHKFRELYQEICKNNTATLPAKIIRAVVETINELNLQAVHALRTGHGGSNPPRTRGHDKAQRRDIDRTFHLHYWKCSDGKVELASVVYHDDFSIPS